MNFHLKDGLIHSLRRRNDKSRIAIIYTLYDAYHSLTLAPHAQ